MHAWSDAELRHQRKRQHDDDQHMHCRQGLEAGIFELVVDERADEKHRRRDNSNPMQNAEAGTDHIPR